MIVAGCWLHGVQVLDPSMPLRQLKPRAALPAPRLHHAHAPGALGSSHSLHSVGPEGAEHAQHGLPDGSGSSGQRRRSSDRSAVAAAVARFNQIAHQADDDDAGQVHAHGPEVRPLGCSPRHGDGASDGPDAAFMERQSGSRKGSASGPALAAALAPAGPESADAVDGRQLATSTATQQHADDAGVTRGSEAPAARSSHASDSGQPNGDLRIRTALSGAGSAELLLHQRDSAHADAVYDGISAVLLAARDLGAFFRTSLAQPPASLIGTLALRHAQALARVSGSGTGAGTGASARPSEAMHTLQAAPLSPGKHGTHARTSTSSLPSTALQDGGRGQGRNSADHSLRSSATGIASTRITLSSIPHHADSSSHLHSGTRTPAVTAGGAGGPPAGAGACVSGGQGGSGGGGRDGVYPVVQAALLPTPDCFLCPLTCEVSCTRRAHGGEQCPADLSWLPTWSCRGRLHDALHVSISVVRPASFLVPQELLFGHAATAPLLIA